MSRALNEEPLDMITWRGQEKRRRALSDSSNKYHELGDKAYREASSKKGIPFLWINRSEEGRKGDSLRAAARSYKKKAWVYDDEIAKDNKALDALSRSRNAKADNRGKK